MEQYKRTKIITSIGPATEKIDNLEKLIKNGSNVARLNFSHGNAKDQFEKYETIKAIRAKLTSPTSLMLDTKGPEIRTHSFTSGQAAFKKGDHIDIYLKEKILGDNTKFSISYPDLDKDMEIGQTILVDDGYLELEILEINEKIIKTKALNDHVVADRRGINIPGAAVSINFLSEKDKADIKFAALANFDYIAISFVQSAKNVKEVRDLLKEYGNENIQLVSKLESYGAVENFVEILEASDAIMVARGDLGVEVDPALVPTLQKKWIKEANKAGKPAIVATQMLESMTYNPRPTRAEVSDVYNAIEDATSAIMLSGESAKGQYWLEAIQIMNRICILSESNFDGHRYYNRIWRDGMQTKYDEIAKKAFEATFASNIENIIVLDIEDEKLIKILSRIKPYAKIIPIYKDLKNITKWGIYFGVFAQQCSKDYTVDNDNLLNTFIKNHLDLKDGDSYAVIANGKISIKKYEKK